MTNIDYIRNYIPSEEQPLMTLITDVLYDAWDHNYGGFDMYGEDDGRTILEIHTGGWSENEYVVDAMLANPYLVNGPLTHIRWEIGGHYWFRIEGSSS